MEDIFYGASAFNQPIGDWNVSKAKDMGSMFRGTATFNQPANIRGSIREETTVAADAVYDNTNVHSRNSFSHTS